MDHVAIKSRCLKQLRLVTDSEKLAAKSVWDQVEQNYDFYGRASFLRLFDQFPTYKAFFMEMTGMADPFESPKFKKHMLHVLLPTWGGIINHLDTPEAVFEALKRLGILHRKMEIGLMRENVEHLGECVLWVLKQNIKNYSAEEERAMTKIVLVIADIFSNSLEGKLI